MTITVTSPACPSGRRLYSRKVSQFPSLRGRELLAALLRLGYTVSRQKGSHRTLEADGRPKLLFSFHDGQEIAPGLVRKILIRDVGLDADEALDILKR